MKEEVTNSLNSKSPFFPLPLSRSSWRLFRLKDINQVDDCDLAWLVELLESIGLVELGIVKDANQYHCNGKDI